MDRVGTEMTTMSTSNTSATSIDNKVKILGQLMSDTSDMFDDVRAMFDVEWQSQRDYEVAWILFLSEGRVKDTGFSNLDQIADLWSPPDDDYWDSITAKFQD